MAYALSVTRARRVLLCWSLICAAGCGGSGGSGGGGNTPVQPTLRVALQVSASPSPVPLADCPQDRCGAGSAEFEITTTLTLRETGGVAGRVESLAITLRRNSDNATLLNTTINPASVQVRFTANGTATVPVAFHHPKSDVTAQSTAMIVVNAVGDTGGQANATLTLPVNGPPTRSGLFITGNYQITQAAVTTTCGDTGTPATVTGWVTLTAPDSFQLLDTGGTRFSGTVQDDGRFVATAVFGPDGSGQTFTQRLAGAFSANGFTGLLDVAVQPRNCAFTRNWTATRLQ